METRALTETELADAVALHPLPDQVTDGIASLGDCAMLLGVSLPTMQKFLRHGLPAVERGGMGKAWRIRLSEAWAWRRHFLAIEEGRRAAVLRSRQVFSSVSAAVARK